MVDSFDDSNKLADYINGGKFDYLSAFILSRPLLHGYLIVTTSPQCALHAKPLKSQFPGLCQLNYTDRKSRSQQSSETSLRSFLRLQSLISVVSIHATSKNTEQNQNCLLQFHKHKSPTGMLWFVNLLQTILYLSSLHHKSIIYNKPTRCNSGSIVFIKNYKYALHVSDALCVHL